MGRIVLPQPFDVEPGASHHLWKRLRDVPGETAGTPVTRRDLPIERFVGQGIEDALRGVGFGGPDAGEEVETHEHGALGSCGWSNLRFQRVRDT